MARYWAVQSYRPGAPVQPEQPCADFGEVIARITSFRTTTADRATRLRVYARAHALEKERQHITELGIELI